MINKENIRNKKKWTRILLTLVVLLSLFSFDGLSTSEPQQKQITRTELIGFVSRLAKRTISLKKAVVSFQTKIIFSKAHRLQLKLAILFHTQFINSRLTDTSAKVLFINKPRGLFDQTRTSCCADEDNTHLTRG